MTGSPPRHEFRFTFDEAFVRNAFRRDRFWRCVHVVAPLVVALPLVRLAYGRWQSAVAVGLVLAIPLAVMVVRGAFRVAVRRTYELWRQQSPGGEVVYRLHDDGYEVVTENAHSRFEWAKLRRLWRYDDVWIVEVVRGLSTFFPPDAASAEARSFLVERCRDAGARV